MSSPQQAPSRGPALRGLPQGGGRAPPPCPRPQRPFSWAAGRGGSLAAAFPPPADGTEVVSSPRSAAPPAPPHTHLRRAPAASPRRRLQTSQPGTSRRPGPGGKRPPAAGGWGGGGLPSSRGNPRDGGRAGLTPTTTWRALPVPASPRPASPRRWLGGTPSTAPLPSARRGPASVRGGGREGRGVAWKARAVSRSPLRRRRFASGRKWRSSTALRTPPLRLSLFLSCSSQVRIIFFFSSLKWFGAYRSSWSGCSLSEVKRVFSHVPWGLQELQWSHRAVRVPPLSQATSFLPQGLSDVGPPVATSCIPGSLLHTGYIET